jgi:arsenate reductase (glutaredoxin)
MPTTPLLIETLYWLPYCSTCQKADQFLQQKGHAPKAYVDIKAEPLAIETIRQLCEAVGGPIHLFSKRAMKYRSMGLDKLTLSDEDMIRYMNEEYTFIKRPVLVASNGIVLAGFSAKQYTSLLG